MVTKKQISKLRSTLIKACNAHIKAGGRIISGLFTNGNGCCPIECATADVITLDTPYYEALTQKLGFKFSAADTWRLIDGFDWKSELPGAVHHSSDDPLFVLGQELRKKYIKP